jgi:hypothetical protein
MKLAPRRDVDMNMTRSLHFTILFTLLAGCSGESAGDAGVDAGPGTGACLADSDCPTGAFCDFPEGTCGEAGSPPGVCVFLPDDCSGMPQLPVCTCDNRSFVNDCERQRYALLLHQRGTCLASGRACVTSSDCLVGGVTGEYCEPIYDGEDQCGISGICERIPTECGTEPSPVCGCDGTTYTNACEAGRAGVGVASRSPC